MHMPHSRTCRSWLLGVAALTWTAAADAGLGGSISIPTIPDLPSDEESSDKAALEDGPQPLSHGVATVGNAIYTVTIDTGPGVNCGTWTAVTGPGHTAGPGLNVLFGLGTPRTSDTVLRSYSSGNFYRTGGLGPAACLRLCNFAGLPLEEQLFHPDFPPPAGPPSGMRLTWTFLDPGPAGGTTVQFVQEVNVEWPVGVAPTTANARIRETHTVRNRGGEPLSFGLRKHWDWQVAADDGPYFGFCETPNEACPTSMDFFSAGAPPSPYPDNYLINSDPAVTACPPPVVPVPAGNCGGAPPYLVAGTVAPGASALSPPPTAPDLLEFNSWPALVGSCWQPALANNANCPAGDTAIGYFYGLTAATAHEVLEDQEESFTEYVVASDCGPIECAAAGPPVLSGCPPPEIFVECDAIPEPACVTAGDECGCLDVTLSETITPGSCADSFTILRTWTATNAAGTASCTQTIHVADTTPPDIRCCPQDATVACDAVPPPPALVAVDNCDPTPDLVLSESTTPGACPQSYTLTRRWTATDNCGNATTCMQVITIRDTTPPQLVGCPADVTAECIAPAPPIVTAVDDCDPLAAVTLTETRFDGHCANEFVLRRTWTGTDACGNTTACTQIVVVTDDVPPVVVPNAAQVACLWPPNHDYVCFGPEDFTPLLSDNCPGAVTFRFSSCTSNQPDNVSDTDENGNGSTDDEYWAPDGTFFQPNPCWNGDGDTENDCVITCGPGGSAVCVRAERAGRGPDAEAGRTYTIGIQAIDACGNASADTVIATVHVPHDQSPSATCLDPTVVGCTCTVGIPCRNGHRMYPVDPPVPECP
jgi:hypothetical protein